MTLDRAFEIILELAEANITDPEENPLDHDEQHMACAKVTEWLKEFRSD